MPSNLKDTKLKKILALSTKEDWKFIFGAEDGILYSMNLEEIRKKQTGMNLLLSSSKSHLLSLHFFFSPYLMFVYTTNIYN